MGYNYLKILCWAKKNQKGFKDKDLKQKFHLDEKEINLYNKVFIEGGLIQHLRYDDKTDSHWYCLSKDGISAWNNIFLSIAGIVVAIILGLVAFIPKINP